MYCLVVLSLLVTLVTTANDAGPTAQHTLLATFGRTEVYRDPDLGLPIIRHGTAETVFTAMGYVHAVDRLWQVFLRYLTANGRLAEFFGPGPGNSHLDSDLHTRKMLYTEAEMEAQYRRLSARTRTAYQGFTRGVQARVKEVNADPDALLPYEFRNQSLRRVPPDVFTLHAVLTYALGTMRSLSDGHYPDYQLRNLVFLHQLQGNQSVYETIPKHRVEAAEDMVALHRRRRAHLRRFGTLTHDGSWAIALGPARVTTNRTMLQAGPQDPMPFPATFYGVFVDSPEAGLHLYFFTEPGMPLNQIYGNFANYSAARTRGYLTANDFLFEPLHNARLHHRDAVQVKGAGPVALKVYRSASRGFVVRRDRAAREALTLRTVFLGTELQGLSSLVEMMFVRSVDEFVDTLRTVAWQSHITHSNLLYADGAGNYAAALNGLWTDLGPAADRRLPQGALGPAPQYTFEEVMRRPVVDVNHPQGYYVSWNGPFDARLPFFTYDYGGRDRTQWIVDYVERRGRLTPDAVAALPAHTARACSLKLGGRGDCDLFPTAHRAAFAALVRRAPTAPRLAAVARLRAYAGDYCGAPDSPHIAPEYLLANAWLYRVVNATFAAHLQGTLYAVPPPGRSGLLPEMSRVPDRLQRLLAQLLPPDAAAPRAVTRYDWLAGRRLDRLVPRALDEALRCLGPEPWGRWMRPNRSMNEVGGVLGEVGSVAIGQNPALNFVVEHGACGPRRVASSLPFGTSGFVGVDRAGRAALDPHAQDQQRQFAAYRYFELRQRYSAARQCEAAEGQRRRVRLGVPTRYRVSLSQFVFVVSALAVTWAFYAHVSGADQ